MLSVPYVGIEKIEEIRNEDPDWLGRKGKFNEIVRKPAFEIMRSPNFYEEAPFLSIAEELLRSMAEGLISEFVFVSSTVGKDRRKKSLFEKTFAKLPLKKHLEINQWGHYTRTKQRRADWIKTTHPDFDMFIDDNPAIIEEVMEVFTNSPEKIYILPDYKCKRHIGDPKGSKVYRVKNTVSNLKNEDILKVAQELKTKIPNNLNQTQNQRTIDLWIIGGISLAGIVIVSLIFYFWKKKKFKKRR